jgi:hypothetical protein
MVLRLFLVKKVTYRPNGIIFNTPFDLGPLQNIEKGVFQVWNCINYHLLSNLKSLEISNNNSITDVSCFENIPILCLRSCSGVTDVSPLRKVHKLDLSLCRNIRDVSDLARVHTLDLSYCDQVRDLSALEWVYSLRFQQFKGTDLSGLKNVVILNITESMYVSEVRMLQTLQRLNIRRCPLISNLNGLVKLKALTLDRVSNITAGKEIFQQMSKLEIPESFLIPSDVECSRFDIWENSKLLMTLYNIRSLVITDCYSLRIVPYLSRSLSLSISNCPNFQGVIPGLPTLQHLVVSQCIDLQFLSIENPPDDDNTLYIL